MLDIFWPSCCCWIFFDQVVVVGYFLTKLLLLDIFWPSCCYWDKSRNNLKKVTKINLFILTLFFVWSLIMIFFQPQKKCSCVKLTTQCLGFLTSKEILKALKSSNLISLFSTKNTLCGTLIFFLAMLHVHSFFFICQSCLDYFWLFINKIFKMKARSFNNNLVKNI